ncbi:MAG: hypothetical protein JXJ04_03210 [Spirochaetales bacterium]|nr:hypothetical protein [Spirochaetales bacterium]
MHKLFIIIILLIILIFPGMAQEVPTFDDLEESFTKFSEGIASSLPYNALIGLNWSDAHIKNFPHFGLGVTIGTTLIPFGILEDSLTLLDFDVSPWKGTGIEEYGVPFPAAALEARIGGFFLPFDFGFKFGFIPEDFDFSFASDGLVMNYFLIGGDIRFRVIKQWFMIPCISIGTGITYMNGSIDIPGILGENMVLADAYTYSLEMQDPALNFNWETLVADIKAQASWDLFLFTPYIGAGASYSLTARAGGGIKTEIIDAATGNPITQADIDAIIAYYDFIGETPPDLSDTQILVSSETKPAWAFRVFGGISLNFFILRLDTMIMYNIINQKFGGSINARIQF